VDLTDAQWELLAPLLPKYGRRKDGRGRPRKDLRAVLNGVLWILRTGAQWADLPDRYPPYQTCHRYFQAWCRDGTLKRILHALAEDLYQRGGIDISEAFIDGTFAGAKRGIRHREDEAWEGDQDHGHCRPLWSSCRRRDCQCFAT
jgi:transposase